MISLSALSLSSSSSSSSSALFYFRPRFTPPPTFLTSLSNVKHLYPKHITKLNQKRIWNGTCRAELGNDVPFALAIGACVLNSLVFPVTGSDPDDETDSLMDSTDSRFAVMGIISFIPYFNWLSWVFAWLDTGKRRYAVYSLVYLAPYLRSNLSLSPEESWLPIASIVFCIFHIQLEASIRNGDFQDFQIFGNAAEQIPPKRRKKYDPSTQEEISEEVKEGKQMNLPSAEDHSRDEIRRWKNPQKPLDDDEHFKGDLNDNQKRKH